MSVPKNKRSEGKLVVLTKAYEFASYTHQICSNEKVFLKRNRWCSTQKIVSTADEIAVNVELANNVNIRNKTPEKIALRIEYQTNALKESIRLETLMEISYRDNNREGRHLPDDKFEYWIGLLLELRSIIRKWRDTTKG